MKRTLDMANDATGSSDDSEHGCFDEFQLAAYNSIMIERRNVFITGAGGCGKSYLLTELGKKLTGGDAQVSGAITSTTGVTALLIGGRTFASFFGFGIDKLSPEIMWEKIGNRSYLRKRFLELDLLVIDEVSMLSAEQLECAEYCVRKWRENCFGEIVFGGLQIVLCGDFSQLPPVEGQFAFKSPVWDRLNLAYHELKGNHRQCSDSVFYLLLNEIRCGRVTKFVRETLATRLGAQLDQIVRPTQLYSRRFEAQKANEIELAKLNASTEHCYRAVIKWRDYGKLEGNASAIAKQESAIRKNTITPETLVLRTGAQVMLTFNLNLDEGLANGSVGIVEGFDQETNYPIVRFHNVFEPQIIEKHCWKINDVVDNFSVSYSQVPLILAWALTAHKAQGATLNCVSIKLDESCFCEGMAYVMLSRARDLNSISLETFQPNAIKTSNDVLRFYSEHSLVVDNE